MRKILMLLASLLTLMLLASPSSAILIDRGGGMIYSTNLDITWLQDANYARTSGYDVDGLMNWEEAMAWADNLSYGGYSDWRLPTFDAANPDAREAPTSPLHEMGYLNYVELGNPRDAGGNPVNTSFFLNFAPDQNNYFEPWYWSGTEDGESNAWRYCFE